MPDDKESGERRALALDRLNEALALAEARIFDRNFGVEAEVPLGIHGKHGGEMVLRWCKGKDRRWALFVRDSGDDDEKDQLIIEIAVDSRIAVSKALSTLWAELRVASDEDVADIVVATEAAWRFAKGETD